MRYAVTVPNFGEFFDVQATAAMAADAETAGWDGFFLWDHVHFARFPVADPWVLLTAIALRTHSLRLGTMVTPIPRRRPVTLARQTVTLDHLSGGRLTLGVGIGAGPWEWEHLGEEADLRARGEMLDEGLDVLTRMWRGDALTHEGRHYTAHVRDLPGASGPEPFGPATVQQPRIPIWVAGTWPRKRPFRRAAAWDGVVPLLAGGAFGTGITADALRDVVVYIRRHRSTDAPFDVAPGGHTTGTNGPADRHTVEAFAEAGATWWFEDVSPFAFGWNWQGAWPMDRMCARIQAGPPRL